MFKAKVEALLEEALKENKTLFLIDFSITPDKTIKIVLDGDEGVNLKDCIAVSRAIEHNLDREEHDFSIEVTSAGASEPIVMPRQYPKNIGRKLIVKTSTENFEGDLTEANEESITLEWKAREPKPVGKGKITVQKRKEIAISEIEEAKVKLKF
ncbi:ribosome assembly cofactor RimP [uncultured Eudoraea sp.]|uniref:ribosome assembly cofactor RimP n=1 Tax=uncultured Eudoraea sp. TaxID=1035614 RepID=UPI0026181EAD|nr:ribosome assembly cofactor RimP [uncultured Eudoraea sp.]